MVVQDRFLDELDDQFEDENLDYLNMYELEKIVGSEIVSCYYERLGILEPS